MFAMIFKWFQVFLQVFQMYIASISLHMFYLDVTKIDQGVAHITGEESRRRRRRPHGCRRSHVRAGSGEGEDGLQRAARASSAADSHGRPYASSSDQPKVAQVHFVASVRSNWGAGFCCLVLAEVPGLGTAFFSRNPNASQMTQMWHAVCVQVILVQHQYSDNPRPWKLTEQ